MRDSADDPFIAMNLPWTGTVTVTPPHWTGLEHTNINLVIKHLGNMPGRKALRARHTIYWTWSSLAKLSMKSTKSFGYCVVIVSYLTLAPAAVCMTRGQGEPSCPGSWLPGPLGLGHQASTGGDAFSSL